MDQPKVSVTPEHVMLYLQEMALTDRLLHTQILAASNRAAFDVIEAETRELKVMLGENPLKYKNPLKAVPQEALEEPDADSQAGV